MKRLDECCYLQNIARLSVNQIPDRTVEFIYIYIYIINIIFLNVSLTAAKQSLKVVVWNSCMDVGDLTVLCPEHILK